MAPTGELRREILLSDPTPGDTEELVPDGTRRMCSPQSTAAVISGNRASRANL